MRKQVATAPSQQTKPLTGTWLDLDALAQVEMTSEDPHFPIENALAGASKDGWRAAANGPQTIRINFDKPQGVKRIVVRFVEKDHERMQEFTLSAKTAVESKHELVRQQWSFSPGGSTEEREDYTVEEGEVLSLELVIDPDRGQNRYPATLAELLIG